MTDLAIADVLGALRTRGQEAYLGEPVTVTEHSLQAAAAAEAEGRSVSLVVAALLHDVGWLLHTGPRPHEERGAEFLSLQGFGPDVTEPVRLHVQAKRYLCTIDPDYRYRLSPESRRTLGPQGGVLDEEAREAFATHPYSSDALALRRYDDGAKLPGVATPDLEHFARLLDPLLGG